MEGQFVVAMLPSSSAVRFRVDENEEVAEGGVGRDAFVLVLVLLFIMVLVIETLSLMLGFVLVSSSVRWESITSAWMVAFAWCCSLLLLFESMLQDSRNWSWLACLFARLLSGIVCC